MELGRPGCPVDRLPDSPWHERGLPAALRGVGVKPEALVARKENVWIVDSGCSRHMDSGCSRHMTGDKNWFSFLKQASKTESIIFGDASTSAILAIDLVKGDYYLLIISGAHISLLSFFFVMHARSGGMAHGRRDGPSRPARRCPAEKAEAASPCLGQGHLVEGGSVTSDYRSVASADFEGFTDLGTSLLARPAVVFDDIAAAAASVAVAEVAKPRAVGPTARSVFAMDCVPLWGLESICGRCPEIEDDYVVVLCGWLPATRQSMASIGTQANSNSSAEANNNPTATRAQKRPSPERPRTPSHHGSGRHAVPPLHRVREEEG
uniref:Retrovirus-related Pol polyprotein from transposon TNT 1-94-like beta-barrel domain-containing protein n=2 Tax=Oryza sativa subsp. japonica TaxID=39947 RepID=Q10J06_ORYSJ|nr:hypothetical protein [Oryza sativa Japonica Group]ABF96832.1 expressed protein [Oryza sativa Japonica Group]